MGLACASSLIPELLFRCSTAPCGVILCYSLTNAPTVAWSSLVLMVLDYVRWAKHDFHLIETSTISTSVAVVDALRTEGIHGMHFLGNTHAPSIFPVTVLMLLAHQGNTVPLQGSDCNSSCYPVKLVQTVKNPTRSEPRNCGRMVSTGT